MGYLPQKMDVNVWKCEGKDCALKEKCFVFDGHIDKTDESIYPLPTIHKDEDGNCIYPYLTIHKDEDGNCFEFVAIDKDGGPILPPGKKEITEQGLTDGG